MRTRLLIVLVACCAPFAARAGPTGIVNSSHNLSATTGVDVKAATNNQICIFCHTPHKAQETRFLWNHRLSTQVYTWDTPTTLSGTPLPAGNVQLSSKRCLACHDGTVALGDVGNAGDGATGVIAMTASGGKVDPATGKLIDATHIIGAGGNMIGNHPFGVAYPGTPAPYAGFTARARDEYWAIVQSFTACTSPTGVCTAAPSDGSRNGAAIKLVKDGSAGNGGIGVECGSCHDTHNQFGFPTLTLVDNSNQSGLCLSCHRK